MPVKDEGMIKKIDLGAAMGGFAQAADAGFVYGELSDGAQVKIDKDNLAYIIGDILGMQKLRVIKESQVDCKLTLSENSVAIVCMMHVKSTDRTPDIAFVSKSSGIYVVNTINKTTTGKGIHVSSDGLYVVISGFASIKRVTAMVISGSGDVTLNAMI